MFTDEDRAASPEVTSCKLFEKSSPSYFVSRHGNRIEADLNAIERAVRYTFSFSEDSMQKAGARVANSSRKTGHPHGPVNEKPSRVAGSIRQSLDPALILRRFGLRLRELRRQHGWTQIQLADYLGIDRSFISDVECGRN